MFNPMASSYKVEFTRQAETEVNSAYLWIAKDAPGNAFRWFEGFTQTIDSLSSMPERCAIAPESEDGGQEIRQLLYGNYRILFSIDANTVFVLHVKHGKQNYLSKRDF